MHAGCSSGGREECAFPVDRKMDVPCHLQKSFEEVWSEYFPRRVLIQICPCEQKGACKQVALPFFFLPPLLVGIFI